MSTSLGRVGLSASDKEEPMLIARSRGAASGVMLILLGLFGALVALVGPYFDFTIGPDKTWNFGEGHLWLSVVPGAAAAIGGLILLLSATRAPALFGAWLALAAGVWFVIGEQVSQLWNDGASIAGPAAGGTGQRVAEHLAYFDALGVLIALVSAFALGRLSIRGVGDAELAAERTRAERYETVRTDRDETAAVAPVARDPEPV